MTLYLLSDYLSLNECLGTTVHSYYGWVLNACVSKHGYKTWVNQKQVLTVQDQVEPQDSEGVQLNSHITDWATFCPAYILIFLQMELDKTDKVKHVSICVCVFLNFFNSLFFQFYLLIFLLYNIALVLPQIDMNLPQVYMCSPS